MTIRYVTTRRDLLYANFRTLARSRYLLGLWSLVIVWICYAELQSPKLIDQSVGYKIGFCVFLASLYYVSFFVVTLVVTSGMILLRKHKGIVGEHRLTVSADGLVESTVHNESLNRWSAYHRTVSTKKYLLLFVTEGQFHIISKRRPVLEGDVAAFEAAVNEKTGRA